jgi:hypothetical protein
MFDRLSRSWHLVKASAAVLSADKELLVFPLVSGLASLLVLATFAVPALLAGVVDQAIGGDEGARVLGGIVAFLFYVVQYSVVIFFNTALVGAAMIRLRGGDPTVADGLRVAMSRIGPILGWAVVSATVGMLLKTLSQQKGVARIVSTLLGAAWGVMTFLVVPVLVVEGVGPIEAVKRSTAHLKRTWGEQLAGNMGMGAAFGLIAFGVILASIGGFFVAAAVDSGVLALLVLAITVLALIVLGLVSSALTGIYAAALYRYAAEGEAGGFFPESLVRGAFEPAA